MFDTRTGSGKSIQISMLVALFLSLVCFASASDSLEKTPSGNPVIVVYRADFPVYARLAAELRKNLLRSCSWLKPVLVPVRPEHAETDISVPLRKSRPQYAIAMGDVALASCLLSGHQFRRAIFFMASDPALLAAAENEKSWCGIGLWVTPETQVRIIRAFFPRAKIISSVVTEDFARQAEKFRIAAGQQGLILKVSIISSPRQLESALKAAFHSGELYWMLPDPELMNNVAIERMLLYQEESRTPVFTFARRLVEMGSACGVYYNIEKFSDMAKSLLGQGQTCGNNCEKIYSQIVTAAVNRKVAERLHLVVSQGQGTGYTIEEIK